MRFINDEEAICNAINIDNELLSKILTRLLGNFMIKDGVGERIRKLKSRDLVRKQFKSSKSLTSSYLITPGIHNLNDTRIINHMKHNKAMKEISVRRNELRDKFY